MEQKDATKVEVEVLPANGGEMAVREPAKMASRNLMDRAAEGGGDLGQMMERFTKAYATIRQLCLNLTGIKDWTINGSDGAEVAQITSNGAKVILPVLGVSYGFSPVDEHGNAKPIRLTHPVREGVFGYQIHYFGESKLLGVSFRGTAARWSDEDFAGRIDLARDKRKDREARDAGQAMETDLQSAVLSLCLRKIAGDCGFGKISLVDLKEAWGGTKKQVEQITRGQGGGTSTERKAAAVTSEDVKLEQEVLYIALGRAVGGDQAAGEQLCFDITKWTKDGKEFGWKEPNKLTEQWKIDNAWKNFAKHPVFGKSCPSPADRDKIRAEIKAEAAAGGAK